MKRSEKARLESRIGNLVLRNSMVPESKQNSIAKLIDMDVMERVWFHKEGYSIYYGYCPLFEERHMNDKIPTYEARVEFQEGCNEPLIEVFKTV